MNEKNCPIELKVVKTFSRNATSVGEGKEEEKSWKAIETQVHFFVPLMVWDIIMTFKSKVTYFLSFLLCFLDIKVMLFVEVCSNLKINRNL